MKTIYKLIIPKTTVNPALCKIKETEEDLFLTDGFKAMIIHKEKNTYLDIKDIPKITDEHYPDIYTVIPKDEEFEKVVDIDVEHLTNLLTAIKKLKKINKDKSNYHKISIWKTNMDNKPIKITDEYQTSIIMPLNK